MQQLHVKQFTGLQPYAPVLLQMQKWIQEHPKNKSAPDELWIMEHHPVYTLGQAADAKHILNPGKIPVIRCDRGGQVTYHGPGQLMLYTLLNLDRLRLNTRTLVRQLEQWIIDYLSTFNLSPTSRIDAPGVYLSNKKICSIGLRISKKLSYHGLAFNINMDLSPFKDINPCGFSELEMTDLNHYAIRSMDQVITELVPLFAQTFNYENWEISKDHEI